MTYLYYIIYIILLVWYYIFIYSYIILIFMLLHFKVSCRGPCDTAAMTDLAPGQDTKGQE